MDLDDLAFALAADGIAAYERHVAAAARALRCHGGLNRTLLGLLADRAAPSVSRERAFGRLMAERAIRRAAPAPSRVA